MKKLYAQIVLALIVANSFAQAPDLMSYQAVVRDASDDLVQNSAVGMQISILQGSAIGTAVYIETHTPTTNVNGLIAIQIGGGTVISGDISTIDWGTDIYFIKTETDPTGGASYSITGTTQMLSVPYALHAKTAESVTSGDDSTLFHVSGYATGTNPLSQVLFDLSIDTVIDEGNNYNLLTNTFVTPVKGRYEFIIITTSAQGFEIRINNIAPQYLIPIGSNVLGYWNTTLSNQFILDLEQGDIISFWSSAWYDVWGGGSCCDAISCKITGWKR